ncbi:unnamed protein product [Acanthoscelides obtectus]|uniref:Uncharacterized protein n=1 Tax=Acanthoscelides obtectus TaxID=200917 RepID=A0A9P0KPT6_ACAOB|nr:unnamed protein product [Acanthoscelides obtectus]CAK1657317.1 hypothetical protein AOBTE_LOCUS20285 [Acanthoscelides obtectus]
MRLPVIPHNRRLISWIQVIKLSIFSFLKMNA